MFGAVQELIVLVLWVVFLGLKGFAFIDCLRAPNEAFPAIGRQTKVLWLALTGIALLTGLLPGLTLSIVGIAGVVVAMIYVFDIRPRIKAITGR
jgi:hypothetical protein